MHIDSDAFSAKFQLNTMALAYNLGFRRENRGNLYVSLSDDNRAPRVPGPWSWAWDSGRISVCFFL